MNFGNMVSRSDALERRGAAGDAAGTRRASEASQPAAPHQSVDQNEALLLPAPCQIERAQETAPALGERV
jgi:hypothetical protein